jgi:dTDP-4-amino-4,6-dideoxygalactose transaminase
MSDLFVNFARPDYGEEEIAALTEVVRSGWTSSGPKTAEFEKAFKEYTTARHALAVNSCTAGLHLALAALDIGPGDEVVTTPLTFCATVNVILERGATPVLADVGPDLNIDPIAIRKALTSRTRAVLPVHIAGLPCAMPDIWNLAAEYGLKVVEDAAHAAGSMVNGMPVGGGRSDATAFSFYATKNLSTGEGGMVTTNDSELENRMRILCLHGISRSAWSRYSENGNWFYDVVEQGFKYNMSDLTAALGLVQLRKLDRMNRRRAEIATLYDDAFREIPELELPPDRVAGGHAWHLYILRLNLDRLVIDRARFFDEMRRRGIGCSVHFIPIPLHTYYRRMLEMRDPCTRALAEYPRLLSLPLYSSIRDDEARRVIESVRNIVSEFKTRTTVSMSVTGEVLSSAC